MAASSKFQIFLDVHGDKVLVREFYLGQKVSFSIYLLTYVTHVDSVLRSGKFTFCYPDLPEEYIMIEGISIEW